MQPFPMPAPELFYALFALLVIGFAVGAAAMLLRELRHRTRNRLRAENGRLLAKLKPFADAARVIPKDRSPGAPATRVPDPAVPPQKQVMLTNGDFFAALAEFERDHAASAQTTE